MVYRLISWCVGSVALLAVQAGFLGAQQPAKPAPSSIDYETIAAYEKIGATYVRWVKDKSVPVRFDDESGLPGFYFRFATNRFAVSKLPQVPVPFAICLRVGEEELRKGLKELAGLKKLAGVAIEGRMSDAGLKEVLDALPQLSYVGLYRAELTEVGIKDLASRKNIISVCFPPSELTDDFVRVLHQHGLIHRLSRADGKDGKRPASVNEVVSLDFSGTKVTNAGLRLLPAMKNLTTFRASHSVTGDGLKDIICLQNVTALDIGARTVLGPDLKGIARFTNLTSLHWGGAPVTDASLSCLREMPALTYLDLERAALTNNGIKELARLKKLATLNLEGTAISDAGLEELRGCANITELNLSATKVTDAGFKHLLPFRKLSKLELSGATDAGLRELAVLNNLTELRLEGLVTDAGMKHLAGHKNLAVLDIRRTQVTADGLKELGALKKLEELRLPSVGEQELRELRRLGMLHVLSTAKAKEHARPKSEKEVVSLKLHGVTDAGLEQVANLSSLLHLDLLGAKVTDKGLRHLAGMKQLQSLDLAKTKVTKAGLNELVGLQNLVRLNLGSTAVPRGDEEAFCKAMPQCVIRR